VDIYLPEKVRGRQELQGVNALPPSRSMCTSRAIGLGVDERRRLCFGAAFRYRQLLGFKEVDGMKELNPKFHLRRESRWVKEYDTGEGIVLDSKYRTFECDADSKEFVECWCAAPESERTDMEAAFAGFPAESVDELESILADLAHVDWYASDRMRRAWVDRAEPAVGDHSEFLLQLMQYLYQQGVRYSCIGENRYFRILSNTSDFQIESLVESMDEMPTDADLEKIELGAWPQAYRHGVRLVRRCRFLLTPEKFLPQHANGQP
jgi:hypothetical protein